MSVIAVIPARGGSKGVPGKNLRTVGGVPLVVRAVLAARATPSIDRVVVSTDDAAIAGAACAAGAEVVDRPAELSGDTASSESALLHALDAVSGDDSAPDSTPSVLVFLQATSPFIDSGALDEAVQRVLSGSDDVVFSAVETFVFLWRDEDAAAGPASTAGATGVNHDRAHRPRRQDREPHYAETGAFYVMRADGFRAARHRFFGRVGIAVVDERSSIEIDTVEELELANAIAPLVDGPRAAARAAARIQQETADAAADAAAVALWADLPIDADAVVTDFDGVLTDDRVILSADGSEYVLANRADGTGVRLLREAGVPMLVLSSEIRSVVAARARTLPIDLIHGSDDKAAALQYWAAEHEVDLGRVAYLGSGLDDLGSLALVGWPIAVADAVPEVRAAARIVLSSPGGHGAVRELAERILRGRPVSELPLIHRVSAKEESHDRHHRIAARR